MCRFINADELTTTGQGLLGNNMFAYCRNNPIIRKDASGMYDICVVDNNDDENPLNDYGSGGGGNSSYHVDLSIAGNSAFATGGIVNTGYSYYYATPTPKSCPNPYGKKGSPAHQEKVHEIGVDLESRGYKVIYEYKVDTPGGNKSTRFVDVYATNGFDSVGVQVGRMTQGGLPVSRERKAMADLRDNGINVVFVRYQ